MQPTNVKDFITTALKRILVSNDTPSPQIKPAQLNDALNELNLITDSWNTDGKMIYTQQFYTFPLVPGKQTYTIGANTTGTNGAVVSTADFDTTPQPRPSYLEFAAFEQTDSIPSIDIPIRIVSAAEWASIRIKQIGSSIGFYVYMDEAYPLANLNIWPVPTVQANIVLTTWMSLNSALGLNDKISLPAGYARGLSLDLSMACAPYYGAAGSSAIAMISGQLNKIKRDIGWVNLRGDNLRYSGQAQSADEGGVYDILTDDYV